MSRTVTTLSKVLICPYFGDQPEWIGRYWANAERLERQGYDFLLDTNEAEFRERVRERLGIVCPPMCGTGLIWDFRPALGYLYAEEIKDFDFWGHTDFDVVYGRVEHFWPDALLGQYDAVSDHTHYFAGPWSLYRNVPAVSEAFLTNDEWSRVMRSEEAMGWSEFGFADTMKASGLRCLFAQHHGFENPGSLRMEEGRLMDGEREMSFFHFRRTKQFPLLGGGK